MQIRKQIILLFLLVPILGFTQTDTIPPKFKGGDEAVMKFLQTNIRYPMFAKDNGIQGSVFVRFRVTEKGSVENVRIVKSPGFDLDSESVRVIKLMSGRWEPALLNNNPVGRDMTLPITYLLMNERRKEKTPSDRKLAKIKLEYDELKKQGKVK
jgi:TonB family protein